MLAFALDIMRFFFVWPDVSFYFHRKAQRCNAGVRNAYIVLLLIEERALCVRAGRYSERVLDGCLSYAWCICMPKAR